MILRNMIFIIADVKSDFAGKVYVDNVRLMTQEDLDALTAPAATVTPTSTPIATPTIAPEKTEEKPEKDNDFNPAILIAIIGGGGIAIGAAAYGIKKKKSTKPAEKDDAAR